MGRVGKVGAAGDLTPVSTMAAVRHTQLQNFQKVDSLDPAGANDPDKGDEPKPTLAVKFVLSVLDPDPGAEKRYVDKAILSMLQDATSGETEPIWMVNKRLFRPRESTPLVDAIHVDRSFVVRLLGNKT